MEEFTTTLIKQHENIDIELLVKIIMSTTNKDLSSLINFTECVTETIKDLGITQDRLNRINKMSLYYNFEDVNLAMTQPDTEKGKKALKNIEFLGEESRRYKKHHLSFEDLGYASKLELILEDKIIYQIKNMYMKKG